MNRFIDTLHRHLHRLSTGRKKLPDVTHREEGLIKDLRRAVNSIAPRTDSHQFWTEAEKLLIESLKEMDPRDFTNWTAINPAMFHEARRDEFIALKHSSLWPLWKKNLEEDKIGNPTSYYLMKDSSGNLVHHAYSLQQLLEHSDIPLSKVKTIFEFGGGYGSFCRLSRRLGFCGKYLIYDLPGFCLLQQYFLRSVFPDVMVDLNGVREGGIGTFWKEKELKKSLVSNEELTWFIAMWSISESPFDTRERFFRIIPQPSVYFIAYHGTFKGYDNCAYFNSMKNRMPNYQWVEYEVLHLRNNFYLIGTRRE
jgi:hypothetical protein